MVVRSKYKLMIVVYFSMVVNDSYPWINDGLWSIINNGNCEPTAHHIGGVPPTLIKLFELISVVEVDWQKVILSYWCF